jgi:hypothetical protein
LVGREISAVTFARDGVEFHFDGPVLRSLADPQVAIGEAVYCFPKPGSRDALCLVIGATVQSLSLDESRHLGIHDQQQGTAARRSRRGAAFPGRPGVAGRLSPAIRPACGGGQTRRPVSELSWRAQ